MTAGSTPVLRPPVPSQAPGPASARIAPEPTKPVGRTEPTGPVGSTERVERVGPALDDLAAALRPAVAVGPVAPDSDEIAAALEDAGITDQSARQSFGQPDVFALARRLLPRLTQSKAQPPRRHAVAPPRLDWSGLLRPQLTPPRLVATAGLVAAVWWLRVPPVAMLPAAAAVPLAELLLAWHVGYARWGLGYHDSAPGWRRHLRRTGRITLAALALPLLAAAGVAGAATHRAGLAPVATGLLGSAGYPLLLILTARRRFLAGASLIALTAAGTVLTHPSLPRMGMLAGGYLAGLVLTAYAVLDPRSRD